MDELRDQLHNLDAVIDAWKDAYTGTEHTGIYGHVNALQRHVEALRHEIDTTVPLTPKNGSHGAPDAAHITYRQEYIRCGKTPCKRCDDGAGHGPYWYAYQRMNGKLTKRYIGKQRPSVR